MKRRIIATIVITASLCMAMSACGSGSVQETATSTAGAEQSEAAENKEDKDAEPVESADSSATETKVTTNFPDLKVNSSGKLKVGLLYHNLETESQLRNYTQTKIECEHRGWDLVEGYFSTNDEGRTAFTSFLTQDVDAIVIGNTEMTAFADLVIQARNAGIGVYNVDNQLVDGVISNAAQANGVVGAQMAYALGEEYMWSANYAIITNPSVQAQMERTAIVEAIWDQYPAMVNVGEEYVNSQGASESVQQQAYNYAKRFFEKEGTELDIIFCSYDKLAAAADEASQTFQGIDCTIVGIDGGSEAWSHIREEGSNFKQSFAQPTELYNHETFELIQQLQVEGLKPGDKGCSISAFGETMRFEGKNITKDNVPDSGASIHAVFDYYGGDPDDADAWYNWTGETTPYVIQ